MGCCYLYTSWNCKPSFEILKRTHTVSESVDQEQHPLLLWFEMERDKGCCQGHSSAFAQPWLSKAERARALETPSGYLLHSACGETAEGKRERGVCGGVLGRMWEGQGQREGSLHFTDTKPYHTVTLWIIVKDRPWAPLSQKAGQNNTPPRGFLWQPCAKALTAAPCKAS